MFIYLLALRDEIVNRVHECAIKSYQFEWNKYRWYGNFRRKEIMREETFFNLKNMLKFVCLWSLMESAFFHTLSERKTFFSYLLSSLAFLLFNFPTSKQTIGQTNRQRHIINFHTSVSCSCKLWRSNECKQTSIKRMFSNWMEVGVLTGKYVCTVDCGSIAFLK